ncbi:MAG: hypothetical protein DRH44_07590 [Candidatus Coatesbacteria bacterium]|nr:MAG: hypothetical protein DRH44_07590 [Candidatus Coatesbacteria bacterium]
MRVLVIYDDEPIRLGKTYQAYRDGSEVYLAGYSEFGLWMATRLGLMGYEPIGLLKLGEALDRYEPGVVRVCGNAASPFGDLVVEVRPIEIYRKVVEVA